MQSGDDGRGEGGKARKTMSGEKRKKGKRKKCQAGSERKRGRQRKSGRAVIIKSLTHSYCSGYSTELRGM